MTAPTPPSEVTAIFLESGTWTCPRGVVRAHIALKGGSNGEVASQWIDVTPGKEYEVVVAPDSGWAEVSWTPPNAPSQGS